MQKHEVENATLFFGITLPIGGWIAGSYVGRVRLTPFPEALTAALHQTTHNPYLFGGLLIGGALAMGVAYLCYRYGDDGFRGASYQRFLRGTRMANWRTVKRQVETANRRENRIQKTVLPAINIGPMPMPLHLENRHLLICAAPGAGKTVAMEGMIGAAIKRRDKLAIVDPNGTFYSKFSFPGDTILNPFDSRSSGWTIFNEVQSVHDFDRMAKSVIPPQVSADDEQWCGYARDILADTMRKLVESNNPDMEALVNLLLREDGKVIRKFLANTDSQGYFRDNAERATASVQFLMNKYVRPLRFMNEGTFSIYEWIHNPDAGNLFITWREDMRPAMRPLVATWIDTICATVLSFEPMSGKRLWLMLDELDSLGKLESFVPAATKGRKHGLRMVGSIQDWAQLDETYGRDAAKVILACFRNYLILGASNAFNADKASEIIGDHEVERVRRTFSANARGGGQSRNISHEKERVILDSEISNLMDLSAYVKFAEEFPLAKIKLPLNNYPVRATAVEIR